MNAPLHMSMVPQEVQWRFTRVVAEFYANVKQCQILQIRKGIRVHIQGCNGRVQFCFLALRKGHVLNDIFLWNITRKSDSIWEDWNCYAQLNGAQQHVFAHCSTLNALQLGHLNFKIGIRSVLIKLLCNKLLRPKYLSLIVCLLAYHATVQHTPDYPSTDNPGCILSTMYFFYTHILNCRHIRISPSSFPVIEKWERRDEWETE